MCRRTYLSLVISILAVKATPHPAAAGLLSMRFAGGASEITLAPSQSATIEVVIGFPCCSKPTRVTRGEFRFDVGALATNPGVGEYVVDSSTDLTVTSATAGNYTNWSTVGTVGIGGPFNNAFILSAGDPAGLSGPQDNLTNQPPSLLASFTIRKDSSAVGDALVVFRADDLVPSLYNGALQWTNRFGYASINAGYQFELGNGNPGDADPRFAYHGFETLQPLVIHQVPEPATAMLLSFAILTLVRGRSRQRVGLRTTHCFVCGNGDAASPAADGFNAHP